MTPFQRALHGDVDAVIDRANWPTPALFTFLQKQGGVSDEEMRRVFNMGIGYCLIVRPTFVDSIESKLKRMGETVYRLGEIHAGAGRVVKKKG